MKIIANDYKTTIYTGANSEYIKKTDEEYKAAHGGKLPWE